MIIPMMFSASRLAPWQAMYTYAGTYSLIVPEGCTSIAGVVIGSGGGGACGASGDTYDSPAGGGGALSYSNAIPVTPGETLTIVVPSGGGAGGTRSDGAAAADAGIKRGSTWLLMAQGGRGGNWASDIGGDGGLASMGVGDVRYSGGKGEDGTSFTYGGWSGRYTSNGAAGSSSTNLSATLYGADTGTNLGRGGSGGRSSANPGVVGGVRVMWGGGRSFPSNAGDIGSNIYRYWRIHIISGESGADNSIALREVQWRYVPGGATQTTSATPVTASSTRAGYPGSNLVDGNETTGWWSEAGVNTNVTLTFDMGVAVSLVELAIRAAGSAGYAPTAFRIDASNDGTSFTTIRTYSPVSMPLGAWSVFAI